MRKYPSTGARRWSLVILIAFAVAACAVPLYRARASNPSSGTLNPSSAAPVTWDGTATGGVAPDSETSCTEGQNCDTFTLNISGQPADWTGKQVRIEITWLSPSSDYDMYVHKDSNTGPVVEQSAGGPTTIEAVTISPGVSGTGVYTVRVVYFAATSADQYRGSARVLAASASPTPAPAPQGTGVVPRYQNFTPPSNTLGTGKGTDAAEPTLGANWKTGKVLFQSYLTTFRITFNDSCAASPASIWEDKSAPTSQNSLDPILWTDNRTGTRPNRTIVSQLAGKTSLSSYTDDDGETWLPSTGGGINSGVDHQSIGGGPYRQPFINPLYPNAVYYCSQDIADALCARSDDGGQTYGPAVPIYNITECGGLHGHPKVAPDGTVYVPNPRCGDQPLEQDQQAVIVSENNGVSWNIRIVPNSMAGSSDPSVEVGSGGRVYFGYANADTKPIVAVSDNRGLTWNRIFDVGASVGINNVAFPAIVAGDNDRAALVWLGTQSPGNVEDLGFRGVWHIYIAHTYDGGQSWITVDATPNDPMQRGAIWLGGGSPIHRNLLDFIDATIDAQGRVLVAYADGCAGGPCVLAPATATGNAYAAVATIARQTGGRPLFAANDPSPQAIAPGAPALSVARDAGVVRLVWSQSDNGGTAITSFKVFRGTTSGATTLLTTVPAAQMDFTDSTTDPAVTYFYRVAATSAQGESCGSNEIAAPPVGDTCNGIRVANDPVGDQRSAPANQDLDIVNVAIAEPFIAAGTNRLAFKMKIASGTLLPNRQYRILWNYPEGPGGEPEARFAGRYYVGMNTDAASTPSFEYGIVTNVDAVPASTQLPERLGDADAGSNFAPDGTITIVLANSKIGNPVAGDLLGTVIGRTFAGNGNESLRSNAAIDGTTVFNSEATPAPPATAQTPMFATYQLVGNNPACTVVTPTPSPTPVPTPTPIIIPTPTPNPSPTPFPSPTPIATPTPEPTPEPTPTPVPTPIPTPTPVSTPTPTPTPDPSPTPFPSPTPTPAPATTVQFSQASYGATEECTAVLVTVTRTGTTTGTTSVNYRIDDQTAKQKGDYIFAAGTLNFGAGETSKTFNVLINEDAYLEGSEAATLTLSNPAGATLGGQSVATLQITDDGDSGSNGPNPIDESAAFVCQQYHDFLNRQGDTDGLSFWTNQIAACGSDAACIDDRRENVSAAFFISVEFQNTGYLVFRFERAAFARLPRYEPFLIDTRRIGEGVIVGQNGAEQQLEQNKQAYAAEFVGRPEFVSRYPENTSGEAYIDALFANAEVTPTQAERNAAFGAFGNGGATGRANALRSVAESRSVYNRQYNPAFVLLQYFGYLRRNPDDAPDNNLSGYNFWLSKMNEFSQPGEDVVDERIALNRVKRSQMVKAFLISGEYRERFAGSPGGNQADNRRSLIDAFQKWKLEAVALRPLHPAGFKSATVFAGD